METINELSAIPSQTISVTEGDHTYSIRLFLCGDFMAYDLSVDDETVIQGQRFVYGQLLILYKRQEVDGNFILDIPVDEDPDYEQFNDTQFLRYLTQDESDAWRETWISGEY